MSNKFASAGLTAGQLNAIVKKLGGHDSALRFLRGELTVSEWIRSWGERDGVIHFSVTSDGTTGEEWIKRLESKYFRVGKYAKDMLFSKNFKPTSGVTTEVVVLKGMLFKDDDRITKKIRVKANKRKLKKPNAEVACLIREAFTDEEITAMGLVCVVAMQEPSKDSDGDPSILCADRSNGGRWLNVCCDYPDYNWGRDHGFAFAVSQVRRDQPRKWTDPIHPGP